MAFFVLKCRKKPNQTKAVANLMTRAKIVKPDV
jgi:hypothetical protein